MDSTGDVNEPRKQDPQVADRLLLLFGYIAGGMLIMSTTLVALLALFRPEADLAALTRLLDTQLSLIIGAVLGYAAHPSTPQAR